MFRKNENFFRLEGPYYMYIFGSDAVGMCAERRRKAVIQDEEKNIIVGTEDRCFVIVYLARLRTIKLPYYVGSLFYFLYIKRLF